MRISYQKLWRMMRDNKMKKGDLAVAAEISDYAMSKLSREEPVSCFIAPLLISWKEQALHG